MAGAAKKEAKKIDRVVEIILYQLESGVGRDFHQIMQNVSAPVHHEAGLEILAFGTSLHSEDAYFLIRVFDSFDQMTVSLTSFYDSNGWKNGPRSNILNSIKTSHKSVMFLNETAIAMLKSSHNKKEMP